MKSGFNIQIKAHTKQIVACRKQQPFLQRDLEVKGKTEIHEANKKIGQFEAEKLSTPLRNSESEPARSKRDFFKVASATEQGLL